MVKVSVVVVVEASASCFGVKTPSKKDQSIMTPERLVCFKCYYLEMK